MLTNISTMVLLLALYVAHLVIASAKAETGVPKPFTEIEQYTILALHNSYRAQAEAKVESDAGETIVRQGNMECLTDKNDNMAMYAQGLANDCPDQLLDNGPYGLALFRRKNARKASPRSYINKAKQLLEHYKAPSNEFNEKQTPEQMNFVRQVYWYQGHELGCGRAICGNDTIIICAYSYKQVNTSMPFIAHPETAKSDRPCAYCSSNKHMCNEDQLCCEYK